MIKVWFTIMQCASFLCLYRVTILRHLKGKQFSKRGNENETTLKIKKSDGSSWPPCSRVLLQKIKRTRFVARRWRCSYMQFQPTSEPCEHGWRLENNKYHIEWFEGQACPCVMDNLEVDEAYLGKVSIKSLL